jgi:hypothetical protein
MFLHCRMVRLRWSTIALLLLLLLTLWISFVARPSLAFPVTSDYRRKLEAARSTRRIPARIYNVGGNGSKEDDESNEDLNLESLGSILRPNTDEAIDGQAPTADGADAPALRTCSVRIDDGGSDLTDRFKYKVSSYRE